jgi:hypothetical protein
MSEILNKTIVLVLNRNWVSFLDPWRRLDLLSAAGNFNQFGSCPACRLA